jgi:predicted nuclease of predicted toxin-antitoxin system
MDVRVAGWLNSQGHDATHLRDEGLQRLPNGGVFEKAIAESRVVVTFDLDFGEIVALSKGRKTGVILFRLRNTRTSFVIQQIACLGSDRANCLIYQLKVGIKASFKSLEAAF